MMVVEEETGKSLSADDNKRAVKYMDEREGKGCEKAKTSNVQWKSHMLFRLLWSRGCEGIRHG